MQVNNIKNTDTNFKSGLTFKIIKDIRNIDVPKTELEFKALGIDANFLGSKTICANFLYAANILHEISERYKLPFHYKPPAIRAYHSKDLLDKSLKNATGFCTTDSEEVLKNEPQYIGCSIFMNKDKNKMLLNEFFSDYEYLIGWHSSPHFLSTTLHEWFHSIHLNLIYKRKGYEGKCPVLKEKYSKKDARGLDSVNIQSNLFGISTAVAEFIGSYAVFSRSMLEVFAELMAKITAQSLDKNLNVIKNPLDNIPKDFPKEYKKEVERILKI